MNEILKQFNTTIQSLSDRIAKLEQDKISYTMTHDVRDNVQKAVISGIQYLGNLSGVSNPVNEAMQSMLQLNWSGKLWNVPININITSGTGAPIFDAPKGSLYIRTDAITTTTRLYINTNGATTWASFTSSA